MRIVRHHPNTLVKIILYLFTLSLLATGCSKAPSDSQIRHKLPGTWKTTTSAVFTVNSDGEIKILRPDLTIDAKWRVEDGFVIQTAITVNGAEPQEPYNHEVRLKIVRINSHELILHGDGQTNLITAYKQ